MDRLVVIFSEDPKVLAVANGFALLGGVALIVTIVVRVTRFMGNVYHTSFKAAVKRLRMKAARKVVTGAHEVHFYIGHISLAFIKMVFALLLEIFSISVLALRGDKPIEHYDLSTLLDLFYFCASIVTFVYMCFVAIGLQRYVQRVQALRYRIRFEGDMGRSVLEAADKD